MVSDYPTTELFSNRSRPADFALIYICFVLTDKGKAVRLTRFILKHRSDAELDLLR